MPFCLRQKYTVKYLFIKSPLCCVCRWSSMRDGVTPSLRAGGVTTRVSWPLTPRRFWMEEDWCPSEAARKQVKSALVKRCHWCSALTLKHHLVVKCDIVHQLLLGLWLSLMLWFVVVLLLCLLSFIFMCHCCVWCHIPPCCLAKLLNVRYCTFCLQGATKAMAWAWWWRSFAGSWPELSTATTSAPGRSPTGSPIWCVAPSWFLQRDLWRRVEILVLNKMQPSC